MHQSVRQPKRIPISADELGTLVYCNGGKHGCLTMHVSTCCAQTTGPCRVCSLCDPFDETSVVDCKNSKPMTSADQLESRGRALEQKGHGPRPGRCAAARQTSFMTVVNGFRITGQMTRSRGGENSKGDRHSFFCSRQRARPERTRFFEFFLFLGK